MTKASAVLVLVVVASLAGCSAPTPGGPSPLPSASQPAAPAHRAPAAHRGAGPGPAHISLPAAVSKPKPKPGPNPCAANTDAQLVLVSVASQHAWMCARTRLVYGTAVTTGAVDLPYDSTPLGSYRIQTRQTDTTLTLLSGAQYQVKYWITFDAPLFGFHDSSWQKFAYGSPRYRTEGSHGCIHMPLAAMKFLYEWAEIGAGVTIRA